MPRPENSYTMPYRQSGNYKKSTNKSAWNNFNTQERRDRIKREKQIIARFHELGYERGKNNNFPCFCGKLDEDTVWWMSNCKSLSNHLFCIRCGERVFEPDIKETFKKLFSIWKKAKKRMWEQGEDIVNLLSKGK